MYLNPSTGLLAPFVADVSASQLHKTFVDCSTIDTATSLHVAKAVASASSPSVQYHFYDAPVSGGTHGALAGTLTFMVGTAPDDRHYTDTLRPLLQYMGKSLFALGGPSLGLVAKLSNNYLSGLIAIATSEAMNLGMRHGVNPAMLREVFSKSSAGNWVNGVFVSPDFRLGVVLIA